MWLGENAHAGAIVTLQHAYARNYESMRAFAGSHAVRFILYHCSIQFLTTAGNDWFEVFVPKRYECASGKPSACNLC